MMAQRTGLEITLMIIVAVALLFAIGRALTAGGSAGMDSPPRRSNGSAAVAFAAMEDMFSASASHARRVLQEPKGMRHRALTPGGLARRRAIGYRPVHRQLTRQTSVTSSPVTEPPMIRPFSGST
jgi:hypothetical protein